MTPYRVVNSAAVAEQFRHLLEQVRGTDRAASVAAEARWILGELARAPDDFGESWLPHAGGRLVLLRR